MIQSDEFRGISELVNRPSRAAPLNELHDTVDRFKQTIKRRAGQSEFPRKHDAVYYGLNRLRYRSNRSPLSSLGRLRR